MPQSLGYIGNGAQFTNLIVEGVLSGAKSKVANDPIIADTTLVSSQSGEVFLVTLAATTADNITVTLPAATTVGWKFKFVVSTAGDGLLIIDNPSASMVGFAAGGAAVIQLSGTSSTTVTTKSTVGDYLEVECMSSSLVSVKGFSTDTAGWA